MPGRSTVYLPSAVRLMALLDDLRALLCDIGPDLLPKETEALTLHAQALAWSMEGTGARVVKRRRMLHEHTAKVYDLGAWKAFREPDPERHGQLGLFRPTGSES